MLHFLEMRPFLDSGLVVCTNQRVARSTDDHHAYVEVGSLLADLGYLERARFVLEEGRRLLVVT